MCGVDLQQVSLLMAIKHLNLARVFLLILLRGVEVSASCVSDVSGAAAAQIKIETAIFTSLATLIKVKSELNHPHPIIIRIRFLCLMPFSHDKQQCESKIKLIGRALCRNQLLRPRANNFYSAALFFFLHSNNTQLDLPHDESSENNAREMSKLDNHKFS